MRYQTIAALVLVLLVPGIASAAVTCTDLPKAEAYFKDHLKPGPNTDLAQKHLAAARQAQAAKNQDECTKQLGAANYYAKKSLAADEKSQQSTSH